MENKISIILVLLCALFISFSIGVKLERNQMCQEAVQQGVAEFVANDKGAVIFKWK